VNSSNKLEEYENLAKLISKGEQIPENLLPLLLEVYQSSTESQSIANGVMIPKEYELIYAEKARKEEILSNTKSSPLQKIRTFNQSKKSLGDWENELIFGDNLKVLKALLDDPNVRGKVNLIYIDPPFATKRDFLKDEVKAYADKVVGSAFIEFTRKRLIIMKELLADNGSIFVHLDSKKGHYIKLILDELFGEHNFKNEIIWAYGAGGNPKNFFPRKHDTIFWYTKGNGVFNSDLPIMKAPYSSSTLEIHYKNIDSEGRRFRIQKVNGREYKTYEDEGKMITDVWTDIGGQNATSPISPEFTGYPTQKPEKLLERIISATTNEGD
jgi:site-specific DNA-methyltransferase (adenine-specific)/adenine-specific DNA-methyltransferase